MRLLLVLALVACGAKSPRSAANAKPTGPVLYDRIGRMDVIKDIVKDLVEEQLMKGSLAHHFTTVNTALLEDSIARQLCELSGGPCKYTGRSMREAHASMTISDADFAAFVTALRTSLAKFKIARPEQTEVVALVNKHKAEIVAQ